MFYSSFINPSGKFGTPGNLCQRRVSNFLILLLFPGSKDLSASKNISIHIQQYLDSLSSKYVSTTQRHTQITKRPESTQVINLPPFTNISTTQTCSNTLFFRCLLYGFFYCRLFIRSLYNRQFYFMNLLQSRQFLL